VVIIVSRFEYEYEFKYACIIIACNYDHHIDNNHKLEMGPQVMSEGGCYPIISRTWGYEHHIDNNHSLEMGPQVTSEEGCYPIISRTHTPNLSSRVTKILVLVMPHKHINHLCATIVIHVGIIHNAHTQQIHMERKELLMWNKLP
jgi:hypothetical protein